MISVVPEMGVIYKGFGYRETLEGNEEKGGEAPFPTISDAHLHTLGEGRGEEVV